MQIIINNILDESNDRQGGDKPLTGSFFWKWIGKGEAVILSAAKDDSLGRPTRFKKSMSKRLGPALALVLFISLVIPMSQNALAQGNVFIVAMQGSAQPPGFAPDLLSVHVYDTVVFINQSNAPLAVVAVDNSFSSPAIAPGQQWKVTFNSPGAFEYHENSSTPHTVGEIVVVPNTVALLPSPLPSTQATAIAFIKAGKTPPDSVWQQATPQISAPGVKHPTKNPTASTLSVPPLALLLTFVRPVILIVVIILAVFASGLGGLWLYRRLKSRKKDDDDDDEEDIDE